MNADIFRDIEKKWKNTFTYFTEKTNFNFKIDFVELTKICWWIFSQQSDRISASNPGWDSLRKLHTIPFFITLNRRPALLIWLRSPWLWRKLHSFIIKLTKIVKETFLQWHLVEFENHFALRWCCFPLSTIVTVPKRDIHLIHIMNMPLHKCHSAYFPFIAY